MKLNSSAANYNKTKPAQKLATIAAGESVEQTQIKQQQDIAYLGLVLSGRLKTVGLVSEPLQ